MVYLLIIYLQIIADTYFKSGSAFEPLYLHLLIQQRNFLFEDHIPVQKVVNLEFNRQALVNPVTRHEIHCMYRELFHITQSGNSDRMSVTAVFDNLGKGASGACIQNINIMLGQDERTGLII